MGLGRLGAREFDLLSDADVLFVCDEHTMGENAPRRRALDGGADRLYARWNCVPRRYPPAAARTRRRADCHATN